MCRFGSYLLSQNMHCNPKCIAHTNYSKSAVIVVVVFAARDPVLVRDTDEPWIISDTGFGETLVTDENHNNWLAGKTSKSESPPAWSTSGVIQKEKRSEGTCKQRSSTVYFIDKKAW